MSDALNYLIKVRPDAIKPYFTFLKEAGRHLDPKTRDLISVITKVHAQTEKGFRQYLGRALRNGASADEILDALLTAFPALGLTKIVWAVDILLQMDLPEFRPEALGLEMQWHDAGPLEGIAGAEVSRVDCAGRGLFVYTGGSDLRVYDSRCPHQATDIPVLAVDGQRLKCPKHEWAFDIATGECIEKGDRPLTRLEHRVEDGRLWVRW